MDQPNRPSAPPVNGTAPESVAPPEHAYLESLVNTVGGVVGEFDWPTGAFTFVSDQLRHSWISQGGLACAGLLARAAPPR